MPVLTFPNFSTQYPNACFVNDTLALTPEDVGLSSLLAYSLTTKPNSSTATVSSSGVITPDLGGPYTITITAGNLATTVTLYAYPSSIYAAKGIGTYAAGTSAGLTRPVGEVRVLLGAVSRQISASAMTAWVAGTYPAGLNLSAVGG